MSLSLGEWVAGTSVSFLQMPSLHPGHYAAASCAWGASSPNGEVGMSHTPPRRGERHKRAASNRDGKLAYRKNGKGDLRCRSRLGIFRCIPEHLCDTVVAMWCPWHSKAKSIFVQ